MSTKILRETAYRIFGLFEGCVVTASFGGGTNSTAMIIHWVLLGLPLALILFADTGGEHPYTYEFIKLFSAWLVSMGYPPVTVVKYTMADGSQPSLEEDCLRKDTLPSKVYGRPACSHKFKIEPQERYVRHWPPAIDAWARGEQVLKLIGFDAEEGYRKDNAEPVLAEPNLELFDDAPEEKKRWRSSGYKNLYPLIEWGWAREECVEVIRTAGLPQPGKSSCWFCPSMHANEIIALKDQYPNLLDRALEMERRALPGLLTVKGLGRNFKWSDVVAADRDQLSMFKHAMVACLPCSDGDAA